MNSVTHDLYEGKKVTLQDLVMQCAPVSNSSLDDYHLKELKKARKRLKEVESWDDDQTNTEAQRAYTQELEYYQQRTKQRTDIRQRYEDMLNQVEKWSPPTRKHIKIKKFLISHLKEGIKFDCGSTDIPPVKISSAAYKEVQLVDARRIIQYQVKERRKEIRHAKARIKWIQELRASFSSKSST
jgi:hypothetical protein